MAGGGNVADFVVVARGYCIAGHDGGGAGFCGDSIRRARFRDLFHGQGVRVAFYPGGFRRSTRDCCVVCLHRDDLCEPETFTPVAQPWAAQKSHWMMLLVR